MDYIKTLFVLYNDKGILILLYLIGAGLIVRLEKNKENKMVFAYSACFLPLVILNPLVGYVMEKADVMAYRMVRIYWILPVVWVIAYGFVLLVDRLGKKKQILGVAVTIGLAMVIIIVGQPLMTKDNYRKADNIYKLPNEVIEVVDKINADYNAGLSESRMSVMPEELATYARLYDGTFPLLYGRMADTDAAGRIYSFMGYDTLNMQEIADGALHEGCGYLVLDSEKACENAPDEAKVTEFARVGKYCLYRLN